MLTGLNATDLAVAKRGTSMNNLQSGPGKDGVFPTTKIDLKVSNLSTTQKAAVLAAIKTYSDGWPAIRKAWKGLYQRDCACSIFSTLVYQNKKYLQKRTLEK